MTIQRTLRGFQNFEDAQNGHTTLGVLREFGSLKAGKGQSYLCQY
jgi:hypothetical protein